MIAFLVFVGLLALASLTWWPSTSSLSKTPGSQAAFSSSTSAQSAETSPGKASEAGSREGNAPIASSPRTPSSSPASTPLPVPRRSEDVFDNVPLPPPNSVSVIAGEKVRVRGEMAVAQIQVGGSLRQVTPNQGGTFERVYVPMGGKVPVRVYYPKGSPGDDIQVEVEDGGRLNGNQWLLADKLSDQRTLAFNLQSMEQPGTYRVVVRHGRDIKILNFWAGSAPQAPSGPPPAVD